MQRRPALATWWIFPALNSIYSTLSTLLMFSLCALVETLSTDQKKKNNNTLASPHTHVNNTQRRPWKEESLDQSQGVICSPLHCSSIIPDNQIGACPYRPPYQLLTFCQHQILPHTRTHTLQKYLKANLNKTFLVT